jgi:Undecaprenyl-phosphate glucose phosphotransferase
MSLFLKLIFFVGDIFFLNLSIGLSYVLTAGSPFEKQKADSVYLFIFSNLVWLFLTAVSNPYSFSRNWGITKILKVQASFIFIHLLVVTSLTFFFRRNYEPALIGTMYLFMIPVFFLWKAAVIYLLARLTPKTALGKNLIIVGNGEIAREVRTYFRIHSELRYRFLGMFEVGSNGLPLEEIQKLCDQKKVDEIYCCASDLNNVELKRLIDYGLDSLIHVKLVTDYRPFQLKSLELEQYDQIPVLNITSIPLDDYRNQVIKRIFDIILSSIVIVTVMSWLYPLVGMAIKINSRGPILFKQKRNGQNNQEFECWKFRTMYLHNDPHAQQATRDDKRITRIGAFLRKSSLDEFPQFLNVFLGTMSIVGPRPHMIKHNEDYSKIIQRFMGRHYVKPGITGLAQSLGYRGETKDIIDMKNRVRLDHFYIQRWSFLFDLRIIWLTAVSLIRGSEKAY